MQHIYNDHGERMTFEKLFKSKDGAVWSKAFSMELGRLAQGNMHGVTSTDIIEFIYQTDVPNNEKVTYGQCVCDLRPLKPKPF